MRPFLLLLVSLAITVIADDPPSIYDDHAPFLNLPARPGTDEDDIETVIRRDGLLSRMLPVYVFQPTDVVETEEIVYETSEFRVDDDECAIDDPVYPNTTAIAEQIESMQRMVDADLAALTEQMERSNEAFAFMQLLIVRELLQQTKLETP